MKKNIKVPPLILTPFVRFDNGEVVPSPNMPKILNPLFKRFKEEWDKNKNLR